MRLSELAKIITTAEHQAACATRAIDRDPEIAINGLKLLRAELKSEPSGDECHAPVLCITSNSGVMKLSISALELSERARKVLSNERIETVGDFVNLGFDGLRCLRRCGSVTVGEIQRQLNRYGVGLWGMRLTWGQTPIDDPPITSDPPAYPPTEEQIQAMRDFLTAEGKKEKRMPELDKALATLTYREREIIKLRFGIGSGYTYTLSEVGRIFKITRERIRQIEAKALRKLRGPVRACQLGFAR